MTKLIDHSTPYFQNILGDKSEDELIENKDYMKQLSLYHKRQHYMLNYVATKEYTPPSWTE